MTSPTGGRPTTLTQGRQDRIVQAVKAGNYLKVAAQWAGIGESTLRVWLQRGRKAAAATEAHDPDRSYCPTCDADRTAAMETLAETQEREDTRAATAGEDPAQAVLNPCPSCHSQEYPRPWELPPAEGLYLRFLAAVTEAESSAEVAAVTHWRAAFPDDWRAARDYLRYRQPERWSPVTRVQITPEEAERRIQEAFEQVLINVGVDVPQDQEPLLGDVDALTGLDVDDDSWTDDDL